MSFGRLACTVGAAVIFYTLVPGCSMPDEEAASAEADIVVDPSAVIGSIARNSTSAPVSHSGSPRLRALSFEAAEGEVLDVWVRSTDGDAVGFIADQDFKTLARNDDDAPGSRDAHIVATAVKTGTHYVVFRERDVEPATFVVTLGILAFGDPVPGRSCATVDAVASARCGACGTKKILCQRSGTGALAWSAYSLCAGETGVCTPGTEHIEACGNCGTRKVTCSATCSWNAAACDAPAAAACAPGTVELTNAGCATGYRQRSCSATCSYSAFSTCEAPPTAIELGPTVGSTSSTVAILGGSLPLISSGACPANLSFTKSTAYAYTQVNNPLPKDATVSIYNSFAPGSPAAIDTSIAVYDSAQAPLTADERRACLRAGNSGNATLTGSPRFASLDSPMRRVTIPAGGSITIYTAAEREDAGAAAVRVSVRTESIAP